MLSRVLIFMLLSSAGNVLAMSYTFRTAVSGRLGGPIIFEFYRDSTTRAKTGITSFGVCVRRTDHRWRPVWAVENGRRVTQPIQYGITPAGFVPRVPPERLLPGKIYMAFA